MGRRIGVTIDSNNFNSKTLQGNCHLFAKLARTQEHDPCGILAKGGSNHP
jgi:hypothetical protein